MHINNLKAVYFDNLDDLLKILELLNSEKMISNKELNEISAKVKNIIDKMYNLSHYYYVMAILALINIDKDGEMVQITKETQNLLKTRVNNKSK